MNAFASFVAGRRTKFVVFGAWFLVLFGALAFNLPGKYTDAEENESSSFLPEDAESTRALAITERLQDGERAPTGIVYQRDGGAPAGGRRGAAAGPPAAPHRPRPPARRGPHAGRPAGDPGRRAGAQRHHAGVPQHVA